MFLKLLNKLRHAFVNYKISRIERDLGFLNPPSTPDTKYWPGCHASSSGVLINIMTGAFSGLWPGYHVSPPNLLESLAGITFEDKINRTFKKVQTICDKMNKAESDANNSLISSGVNNGRT